MPLKVTNNADGSITISEVKDNVSRETLADWMEPYIGTYEYNGIVAECQEWFYGHVSKTAWCATFLSFALYNLGILEKNLSKKQENVYYMYADLAKHCQPVSIQDTKRGDIVVLNFSETFSWNSNKHITVAYLDYNGSGLLDCVGGNQSDMVCRKMYAVDDVIAVFRPIYD